MHAAKLLEILDCLSSVEVFISHVSVALASSEDASVLACSRRHGSSVRRQLVHAQPMIVVVMLYCKLVGVPGARQALLAKGQFHIDIWRRGVNDLKVVLSHDTREHPQGTCVNTGVKVHPLVGKTPARDPPKIALLSPQLPRPFR